MKKNIILALIAIVATACQTSNLKEDNTPTKSETIHNLSLGTNLNTQLMDCSDLWTQDTRVFVFNDSVLINNEPDFNISKEGKITISTTLDKKSMLYFIATPSGTIDFSTLSQGTTTHDEFKGLVSSAGTTSRIITATFHTATLSEYPHIDFTRQYSGVNIELIDPSLKLKSANLSGVYSQFAIFNNSNPQNITNTHSYTFGAYCTSQNEVFRLYSNNYPTTTAQLSVTVEDANGEEKTLNCKLPKSINNGLSYTATISDINTISITEGIWNGAEITTSGPDYSDKILFNNQNAILPEGAYLSTTRDTLFMPYRGGSVEFSLVSNSDLAVYSSQGGRVTVSSVSSSDTFANRFCVEVGRTNPIGGRELRQLQIHRLPLTQTYAEDFLTIVMLENPVVFDQNLIDMISGEWTLTAREYIEDTISTFSLPVGYTIRTEGDWLRVGENSKGQQVFEAAYTPNDPTGDGSLQSAQIIITDQNNIEDVYTIHRPNWSIPVVYINDRYWAKFNQRGDAESFEDQIRVGSELDQISSLLEFSKTATAEEYYQYVGDQYLSLAVNTPLIFDPEKQLFTNYSQIPQTAHIATAAKEVGCPTGFERPSINEILTILLIGADYGNSSTGSASSSFNTNSTVKYRNQCNSISRTGVSVGEGDVTTTIFNTQIHNLNNTVTYSPLMMSGFGYQGSASSYDPTNSMFAMYYPGSIYVMKATCVSNFNISQSGQSMDRSYTLRCIKKPIDFTITNN